MRWLDFRVNFECVSNCQSIRVWPSLWLQWLCMAELMAELMAAINSEVVAIQRLGIEKFHHNSISIISIISIIIIYSCADEEPTVASTDNCINTTIAIHMNTGNTSNTICLAPNLRAAYSDKHKLN